MRIYGEKLTLQVIEETDNTQTYGLLSVYNATPDEVQKKIVEIKKKFDMENFKNWTIGDLVAELPGMWKATFVSSEAIVQI